MSIEAPKSSWDTLRLLMCRYDINTIAERTKLSTDLLLTAAVNPAIKLSEKQGIA